MRTFIFTLDDRNATRFINRRQSNDTVVAKRITELCKGVPLYIRAKSESFFFDVEEKPDFIRFNSLIDIPDDAVIFAEDAIDKVDLQSAKAIHVFRWNRIYPSLVTDRIDLHGFYMDTIGEFAGSSHEKITEEVYTPCVR